MDQHGSTYNNQLEDLNVHTIRNADGRFITGVPEVDQVQYPVICYLASNPVYEAPPHVFDSKGKGNYIQLHDLIEEANISTFRQSTWFVVEWAQPETDVRGLLQQLTNNANGKKRYFCVGTCVSSEGEPTCVLALVLKIDRGHLTTSDLILDGMGPVAVYKVAGARGANTATMSVIAKFGQAVRECASNFIINEAEDFTMKRVIFLTEHLNDEQFATLVGDAKIKQRKKDCSDFQKALLGCLSSLQALRSGKRFEVALSSSVAVAGWEHLQNLHQPCTRLDEQTGDEVSITLYDYIKHEDYHLNHALIILGGDETTGFGKSQFAMRFVQSVAAAKSKVMGEVVTPIFARTFDILREAKAQLAMGAPVLFDEVRFSDVVQIQFLSNLGFFSVIVYFMLALLFLVICFLCWFRLVSFGILRCW